MPSGVVCVIKFCTSRTRHCHRLKRLKWPHCRGRGGVMNKYPERGVSKGEIPHSLTHRISPFALIVNRPVDAKRACSCAAFSMHEQVRLITYQQFSTIKSVTYVIFSRLTDAELTPSTKTPPLSAAKREDPLPPPPVCISRGWGEKYSQLFERSKL